MGGPRMTAADRRDLVGKIEGYASQKDVSMGEAAKHFGITGANFFYHKKQLERTGGLPTPPLHRASQNSTPFGRS
jgi:hypothetical protein